MLIYDQQRVQLDLWTSWSLALFDFEERKLHFSWMLAAWDRTRLLDQSHDGNFKSSNFEQENGSAAGLFANIRCSQEAFLYASWIYTASVLQRLGKRKPVPETYCRGNFFPSSSISTGPDYPKRTAAELHSNYCPFSHPYLILENIQLNDTLAFAYNNSPGIAANNDKHEVATSISEVLSEGEGE